MKKVLSLITALILFASPVFATKQAGSVTENATPTAVEKQEVKKPVKKVKKVKKAKKAKKVEKKQENSTVAPEKM